MHVRPLSQDKAFNAMVFDAVAWGAMLSDRPLDPALECWVSPLQDITAEWRCWIVGGRMVAATQYRKDGQMHLLPGAPPEVGAFVNDVAKDWLPAPCVVVDVALSSRELRVLEFNPFQSSGWYAVDIPTVLDAWLAWSVEHFR